MDITKLRVNEKDVKAQEAAKHDSYYDHLRRMKTKELVRVFGKTRRR